MDQLPDVSGSSVVVYVTIVTVVVLAIGTATDKGLGPLSRWWFSFSNDRRAAAAARDDADIADLKRQVTYLTSRVEELSRMVDEQRRTTAIRDRLAIAHQRWDVEAQQTVNGLGGHLSPPPPLWPDTTVFRQRRPDRP